MSISSRVRVALVGCGGMARCYRAAYARLPNVEFVLAVDPAEEPLAACRALGVRRTSSRFEDALSADVDMVDVSTPNFLHETHAVAALEAGKHVLLQKPMSNSVESADRIVAAARRAKGTLGMYMSSFANPLIWEAKRILDAGLLGQIQSVRARDAWRGGLLATGEGWRASREKTGGGSFLQLSIHAINVMQWWLGRRISEVCAYSANQYSPNIGGDDVTVAIARFDGPGVPIFGTFDSGWASEQYMREIHGTRGSLRFYQHDYRLELTMEDRYEGQHIQYTTPRKPMTFEAPPHDLDDTSNPCNPQRQFVEAILAGKPPLMDAEAGRQDLAVVMAAYESAKTNRPVKLR